ADERHPIPTWVVVGAGTGGTSATIGRYLRYRRHHTQLCVVDPENSVFYDCYRQGRRDLTGDAPSRIEGIGRPRCEPSFVPEIVDRMIKVPDAASLAAMRVAAQRLGRRPGGSTGTNVHGALQIIAEMAAAGRTGSVVTLFCDPGDRYGHTYYDDAWLRQAGLDIEPYIRQLDAFLDTGTWSPV
ncbi:MAG: pyridoxal-phosphate dependent enzyme, partial [Alphaproteobacteria bacterium]|nr:pyridoxal-phosphate dependent enzyme [Alphaproteobacteria bacterium]